MIHCPRCSSINVNKSPHDKIELKKVNMFLAIITIKRYKCAECGYKFKIEYKF